MTISTSTAMPPLAASPHAQGGRSLSKLAGAVGRWYGEQLSYRRALNRLRQLDDADLDDIAIARADLPMLARRHASGAAPLIRPIG